MLNNFCLIFQSFFPNQVDNLLVFSHFRMSLKTPEQKSEVVSAPLVMHQFLKE